MKNQNKITEMENGEITKLLFKFGIPTTLGMLIMAFYNLVDGFFIGGLGTNQMAAVSLVYPITLIITGLGVLFGCGAGSIISRALGDSDYDKVSKYTSTTIWAGTLAGIVVISTMLIGINPLLHLLGANAATFSYAKIYAKIIMVGLAFSMYNIICNHIIVSEGATGFSASALITGGVLNMILDPVFVYIFNFGVEGVAYATLISSMISTALYTVYLFSKKTTLGFSITKLKFSIEIFSNIFKIGVPPLAFQILISLSLCITNMVAVKYGNQTVAALGIVNRILSMEMMAVFGFLKGFQPLVGYNYGAGNTDRVHGLTKKSSFIVTVFCIIFNLICILFSKEILMLFNKESADVINFGMKVLRSSSITYMTLGFQLVYASYFLAVGKAKEGGILSIVRQGIVLIPLLFILTSLFGKTGLIFAQPISDLVACIVTVIICVKTGVFKKSSLSIAKQQTI